MVYMSHSSRLRHIAVIKIIIIIINILLYVSIILCDPRTQNAICFRKYTNMLHLYLYSHLHRGDYNDVYPLVIYTHRYKFIL